MFDDWRVFALGSAFFAALTAIFGKLGVTSINSNLATFIRTVVILFIIGILITMRREWQLTGSLNHKSILFLILSAMATGGSWLCYYRALQLGPVSKVAPVDKLSVALVLILSFFFLSEQLDWRTLLGGTMIVAGSIILIL